MGGADLAADGQHIETLELDVPRDGAEIVNGMAERGRAQLPERIGLADLPPLAPTLKGRQTMPFVNIKTPEAALTSDQKAEIGHRVTEMLVEYFSEAARPHTMVLIEEVLDGGYYRADEPFSIPEA